MIYSDEAKRLILASMFAGDSQTDKQYMAAFGALGVVMAELETLKRELWAVRVLDAWAEKHEEASPPHPIFHLYMVARNRWTVLLPGGIRHFESASAARIAAAEVLTKEDPTLLVEADEPPTTKQGTR